KPTLWVLGTSEKSIEIAIGNKLNYVFGHFMSNANGPEIINNYRDKFFKEHETNPEIIIAVSVICAETTKQAEKIARSTAIWSAYNDTFEFDQIPSYEKAQNYRGSEESEIKIQKALNKMIIGNQKEVSKQLKEIKDKIAKSTAIWSNYNDTYEFDKIPSYEKDQNYRGSEESEIKIQKALNKMIIGNPKEVSKQLKEIKDMYQAEELMLVTNTYDYKDRLNSFKLLANEVQLS